MIRLFFKSLWNNKRRNILVFIELFMISFVMVNLIIYLSNIYAVYRIKNLYDTHNVVLVEISNKVKEPASVSEQPFRNLKKVFEANPFVESVTICQNAVPFTYNFNSQGFARDSDRFGMNPRTVDMDYGKVMKAEPLQGRWFNETDLGKSVLPVMITTDINDKYFKGNGVGQRFNNDTKGAFRREYEIVGVVERFKRNDIEKPFPSVLILMDSIKPLSGWETSFLIRTKENKTSDMLAIAESQVYATLNPENWTISSLNSVENMHSQMSTENYQQNYITVVIALFILINVLLGTIGILWYNTNLRIHEIGIKRALGSTGSGIKRLLITENLVIAGIGLLIVLVIVLQVPITGQKELEPGVMVQSIIVSYVSMTILVLLSTWIPSSIASKIRPATALKTE
jgi:putative ABC transport system permease protein